LADGIEVGSGCRFGMRKNFSNDEPGTSVDREHRGVKDVRADLAKNGSDEVTGKKQHQACGQGQGVGVALRQECNARSDDLYSREKDPVVTVGHEQAPTLYARW
jgi:hypothetical protein